MQLRRMSKAAGGKKTYPKIQDERQVKRPNTPYTFFFMERLASGDMKQMKVQEIGPLAGREWRALPAQEKKVDLHMEPCFHITILTARSRNTRICTPKIKADTFKNIKPSTAKILLFRRDLEHSLASQPFSLFIWIWI